ncbi:MAG: PHP domain-containing protein [Proteobacteria bacterium]|nr:PHP domain-containing protein [Pseudomonadota bacterium]
MARLVAVVLALLLAGAAQAAERKPDLILTGTIVDSDNQTYREVPFAVPAGTTRVTVRFSYTGKDKHTTIDLGLFGSERFRGWSGGNKGEFTLSETDATPSYLPGPLPAGTWKLVLGIPNIRKGVSATYEAQIWFGDTGAASTFSDGPLATGPAWFRGDLHMHDAHSDGECKSQSGNKVPCPLYKTVEAAAARHLDFIAISDHNAISQFDAMRELQPYFDKTLLIPAREITTFHGHANVYGTTGFIDFRLGSATVPDLNALLDRVAALGGLFTINHPALPSGEICMGCGWTVPDTDYARIPAIEIINGGATALFGNADNPISGIAFWQDKLNRGYRITAIGGSDNHDATAEKNPVGAPVTAVFAANLSESAILAAIRAGHVFIDAEGDTTRLLELTARNGKIAMGDTVTLHPRETVRFDLHIAGAAGAHAVLIEDGKPLAALRDGTIAGNDVHLPFQATFDGKRHWLRAEVRDAKNRLLLIGNPIYINAGPAGP